MIREFVICPGVIRSKSDKQIHYIGPSELMWLYGVQRDECLVLETRHYDRPQRSVEEGLLYLSPNYDGDYSLPDVEEDPCTPYQSNDAIVQLAVVQALQKVLHILP